MVEDAEPGRTAEPDWSVGHIEGTVSLGVDLSTEASATALVAIVWRKDGIPQLACAEGKVAHDELVRILQRWHYSVAAVDVPFGWPDAFVETLQRHQTAFSTGPRTCAEAG